MTTTGRKEGRRKGGSCARRRGERERGPKIPARREEAQTARTGREEAQEKERKRLFREEKGEKEISRDSQLAKCTTVQWEKALEIVAPIL